MYRFEPEIKKSKLDTNILILAHIIVYYKYK